MPHDWVPMNLRKAIRGHQKAKGWVCTGCGGRVHENPRPTPTLPLWYRVSGEMTMPYSCEELQLLDVHDS